MNQRFQRLTFASGAGMLSISAPTSRNRTPPGHYLLFILDGNGVPSVAKIVQVGSVSDPNPAPPPNPSVVLSVTGRVDATSQYIALKWSGAAGSTVDIYRNGRFLRNVPNSGSFTNSVTFTGAASYGYKLCEVGNTRCSNGAAVQFSVRTAPPMPLNVTAWTEPTRKLMDLSWSGVSGTTVDVYRNGGLITNTANDGRFTNSVAGLTAANYTYKVCPKGMTTCSAGATVRFPLGGTTNVPPTAAFSQRCDALSCTFTESSTDRDGSIVQWQWNFGDGSSSTLRQPSRVYAGPGSYTVTLVVKDNLGASGAISKLVTVTAPLPPNLPPKAAFTSTCNVLSCTFTDGSSDDGTIITWAWNFGDGRGSSPVQNPSYAYEAEGNYEVTLTVTDDKGASGTFKDTVTVTAPPPPNQPPVADFTWSCIDLTCTFIDGSTDDASVTGWSWNFGDSSGLSVIQNPSYTYAREGSYEVSLTATDGNGVVGVTVTRVVTVPPAP
jgi:PKD repeat protein